MNIFTICACNYLSHASVLGDSVSKHHPVSRLTVFLLDAPPAGLNLPSHIEIIPAERAFSRAEWNHRQAHYDILEFATSVKPACFRFLFARGAQRAIYLDPDIRIFRRVDAFWSGDASDDALVLTPHILTPLPEDGHMPDDLVIMRAGLYNMGFAAMRNTPDTNAFLQWWDAKLHDRCLRDVREGVFTDQKWIDFAPLFLPATAVLRHPGFNVAYWNLHERSPRWTQDGWRITSRDGQSCELVFFHFSGFQPDRRTISRHESRFGSVLPGDTRQLLDDYAEALGKAGLRQFGAIALPRIRSLDGTSWDTICRTLYQQATSERLQLGDPLDAPDFLSWAASRASGDHLSRYFRKILQLRPDVAQAYDDGRNIQGLHAWLRSADAVAMGVDSATADRCSGSPIGAAMAVNHVGYLRSHLGIGEAARQTISAVQAADVVVRVHDISALSAAPTGTYTLPAARADRDPAPITILGCNADVLPAVLAQLPPSLLSTYRIGCWYWETPDFPEHWTNRFDLVDEIWVATQFVADAVRESATVPVVVMPPMVQPPPMARDRRWLTSLLPETGADEFVFLFQFDTDSVPYRKNPEGLIAAFNQAFSPREPVRLVLKLLNGDAAPELLSRLRQSTAGRRISLLDAALESEDRFRLLANADCFVSLHRSEGFGLSIAEAMAYGLPVVTTGWSGNADFTNASNAALVAFDLIRSTEPRGPYPAGTRWAEPRQDDAARQMRRIWLEPDWRDAIGKAGAETIGTLYSQTAVGTAMRARLARIARSARLHLRQPAAAMPGPAVAPNVRAHGMQRAVHILRDVRRFPAFYVARLPRLPTLLWKFGLTDTITRAEAVATGAIELKRQYGLVTLAAALRAWFVAGAKRVVHFRRRPIE